MANIKDETKYSPEIAALFCGELRDASSHKCLSGNSEHVCEEKPNHTGSHICGNCGETWSEDGFCC